MPKRIATGRHAAELAAEYHITGHLPLRLDETVVPVAVVSELAPPATGRPCAGAQRVSPGGAQVGEMLIIAPGFTAPEYEAQIERIVVRADPEGGLVFLTLVPAGSALAGFVDGDLGQDGSRAFRDRRLQGSPRLLLQGRTDDLGSNAGFQHTFTDASLEAREIPGRFQLHNRAGASSILIRPDLPGVQLWVSVYWRESDVERRDR